MKLRVNSSYFSDWDLSNDAQKCKKLLLDNGCVEENDNLYLEVNSLEDIENFLIKIKPGYEDLEYDNNLWVPESVVIDVFARMLVLRDYYLE